MNKNKIKDRIAELMEEDMYTISQICEMVGIGRKTFYRWRETDCEFAQILAEAEQRRGEALRQKARSLIRRKMDGYTQRIERTVYIPSDDDPAQLIIKQHVVTEKNIEPDMRFLMQLLAGDKDMPTPKKVAESVPFAIKVSSEKTGKDIEELDTNCVAVVDRGGDGIGKINEIKSEETTDMEDPVKEEEMRQQLPDKESIKDAGEEPQETPQERQKRKLYEYMKKHEAMFVPPPLRGIAYKLIERH